MATQSGILASIVRFSLRFRLIVIVVAAMLVLYGLFTLTRVRYDVFPEFAPPHVTIRVEAPGFSPEQVEKLVTVPVETAISGVEGIASFRSSSLQGLSAITVTFRAGSDIYRVRQMVAERLAPLASRLPQGVAPYITPLTSSTGNVLQIGLSSDKRSMMELRTVGDWLVKPRLLAVSGVAGVQVFGGELKQIQIQVVPQRLIRYGLSMDDVVRAARKATGVVGAGFIDTRNQRLVLQTEGQSLLPAHIAQAIVLPKEGANVTLGDVATVVEAPAAPVGAALIDGRPAVVLLVSSQYGANTLEVTSGLDKALGELRSALAGEGVVLHPSLLRPATFIHTALHNVFSAMLVGAVLVIIILLLFLFNLRTAAISFTAIPLSLLAAVTVMEHLGFSLNTMVLGGLAIAIGEIVDDAVVDVENIYLRLRENQGLSRPRPTIKVVLDASLEVRSAVVFATFCVIIVFIPLLTLSGLSGRLFAPLGVAYIFAVAASLLTAVILTPALSLLLLGRSSLPPSEPPLVRFLKSRYSRVLADVERRPRTVIVMVAVLIAAGVVVFPFLSSEFLPQFNENDLIVHMVTLPGTSLEESVRLGHQVATELFHLPGVAVISQKTGRATEGSSIRGTNASEIDVSLKAGRGRKTTFSRQQVRKMLVPFPGADFSINTFLTERINETLSGYTAGIVVNIFGNNLEEIYRIGGDVASVLRSIPGAADITVQSAPGTPQIVIEADRDEAARWGFDPVELLSWLSIAYQGTVVGQIYEGERIFDVAVILNQADRSMISALRALPVKSPGGSYVPLGELATIREVSGPSVILHEGGRRVQTITCNASGRDAASVVAAAKRDVAAGVSLPAGTYINFTGTAAEQARSRRELLLHSVLAGVGVVLLLSVVVGNYRNLLLVLLNIPFALVGSIFAVFLTGGVLSLGSMVGFITVFGITLRNSIMMISHFKHLVAIEDTKWGSQTASRGASDRLAPILMTALVTGFGLLPLAIGMNAAGREIEGPMAVAILGGLITSTTLNLLVLPSLALRFGRFERLPRL